MPNNKLAHVYMNRNDIISIQMEDPTQKAAPRGVFQVLHIVSAVKHEFDGFVLVTLRLFLHQVDEMAI